MTRRILPLIINGGTVREVGIPGHGGWQAPAEVDVVGILSVLAAARMS